MSYKIQVENFLNKKSEKQKLVVIYGPTGAGKTAMSIEIAQILNTEIISTDSRQIYRWMDIGTGKITQEEMQGITHHMIDIINPDEKYSVWAFKCESENILDDLYERWKIPMLVGGTGLYIDSLIFDMNIGNIPADQALREKFETLSTEELFYWLQDIDPEYALEIHPNNRPYLERWIEVMLTTWKSKRNLRQEKELKYDVLFLTPQPFAAPFSSGRERIQDWVVMWEEEFKIELWKIYRKWLYSRINTRVEQMFEQWLEEEVTQLIAEWYCDEDEGMRAIGYQEFFPYLRGEISREECIWFVQQHSRNYAKRQLNWFSKYQKYISE